MKVNIKKAMIWKTGTSAVVTIPAHYIENGILDVGKEYDIVVVVKGR